jgi:hypothetical protein
VRLPFVANKPVREVFMLGQRIAIASVVAAIISLQAVAQTSDTGPVTFPPATQPTPAQCDSVTTLPGPGPDGRVFFNDGGFFARNGAVYFGTFPNQVTNCSNWISIQFAPAATDVSFTLTNIAASTIQVYDDHVIPTSYTLPRGVSVAVTIPGPVGGVLLVGDHGYGITGLTITQHPVSIVQFDLNSSIPSGTDQTKILMSKATWDIGYPSTAQVAPDSAGNPQVRIAGTLRDKFSGQPKSGSVYLRVTDPRDTAPYRGADAHDGDNDDPHPAVLSSTTVQADAQGRFEGTLVIHSRTAGDNYQIVGSTNETFNCGGLCPRTAVLTLWKRTYVEDASMFRRGAFLTDGADAGTMTFGVTDAAPFQNLVAGAPLKLIHADAGLGDGFYWEIVYFRSVQHASTGNWTITVDSDPGLTGQGITHDYGTSVGGARAPSYLPWAPLLGDAIGVVDADTYLATTAFVGPTLADAFVEMHQVPILIDEVPHLDNVPPLPNNIQFSDHWFEHSQGVTHAATPNVLHRVAASQSPPVQVAAQNGMPAGWGVELGVTVIGGGSNVSFIFDQRITELSAGPVVGPHGILMGAQYQNTNSAVVNARTTAHETVHFWVRSQRQGVTDTQGHCHAAQYDEPTFTCLMHQPAGANGLDSANIHMHYFTTSAGTVDSEYLIIRRADDPVPQN